MAAGVGAGEIIEHDKSGIVFRSEDAADLAEAFYGLVKDPEHWACLASRGQSRALDAFNIEHSVDQLERQLSTMHSGNKRDR